MNINNLTKLCTYNGGFIKENQMYILKLIDAFVSGKNDRNESFIAKLFSEFNSEISAFITKNKLN